MYDIKILKQSKSSRCEICHKADQFDNESEVCQRCQQLIIVKDRNSIMVCQRNPLFSWYDCNRLDRAIITRLIIMLITLSIGTLFYLYPSLLWTAMLLLFNPLSLLGLLFYVVDALDDKIIDLKTKRTQLELWQLGLIEGIIFGLVIGLVIVLLFGGNLVSTILFLLALIFTSYHGILYGPFITEPDDLANRIGNEQK
jgi:hypothetical protein